MTRKGIEMGIMETRVLGQTGLEVGPLGVAASFGAPAEAFEEAFDKGCNYFYWGSLRKNGMREAIKNICSQGCRDDLIIVIQSYSRSSFLMQVFVEKALKSLSLDYADILLLGWHNNVPSQKLLDKAMVMKQRGLYRFLGISGHNRSLFPQLARGGKFDIFHIRYNAAHRGAEQEAFPFVQGERGPGIVSYTATRWGQLLSAKKMPPGEAPPSASDCYRFVLSNPAVDVCICGPKDRDQMREALRTLELGPLTQDQLVRMRKIGDYLHAHAGKFFW
jgi:aryl-alcohol dehydrogenase-like predicted oxidoreductase